MAFNIVEAIAGSDECAFNQRCKFGHLVTDHAVYCHNDAWVDGPRKCRRSWYTNGKVRDEDCPGFQPNEAFIGQLAPVELHAPLCSECHGVKLVTDDPIRKTVSTCDLCQGTGEQPAPMELAKWEVYVLESCVGAVTSRPGFDEYFAIPSGAPFRLKEFPLRLLDDGLLELRSIGWDGPLTLHTVRLTRKGYAALKIEWKRPR